MENAVGAIVDGAAVMTKLVKVAKMGGPGLGDSAWTTTAMGRGRVGVCVPGAGHGEVFVCRHELMVDGLVGVSAVFELCSKRTMTADTEERPVSGARFLKEA